MLYLEVVEYDNCLVWLIINLCLWCLLTYVYDVKIKPIIIIIIIIIIIYYYWHFT